VSACRHEEWEPVEVAGETVANICTRCLDQLPARYSGKVVALELAEQEEMVEYLPVPDS
jgi:hypothetical protein